MENYSIMIQAIHSPNTPYPSMAFLFDALVAPVKLAVLETAIELDMAHILCRTGNVDDIAKRVGAQANTTGLIQLLDAMASMGLANKENSTYSNTEIGTHFLDKNSPVFMGEYIQSMKDMVLKNMAGMTEIIKNGSLEGQETETWESESRWKRAVTQLATWQRAGTAAIYADLVEELPEFKGIKKILDLGGGPGLIGAEILGRLPGAKGVLLDLPTIIPIAEKEIENQKMADRISFISGDYNETDLGCGYDLIWTSHNLYFVKDRDSFFRRVKNALSDNGVFVCLHEGLSREKTAPERVVLMRLSSALEKDGQSYFFEKGEIVSYLEQAGFHRVDSRMIEFPAGEFELVVARRLS